nr:opioid growth factor receptor-related protein [uncultured Vibrio sp.]
MSDIVEFHLGKVPDHQGRYIRDIWALNDFWLEHDHKYVQWLFPIDASTKFNAHAPVLSLSDRVAFSGSKAALISQRRSFEVMLRFFGLVWVDGEIVAGDGINLRDHIWLKRGGHNHYRISRIIRSLALCGQLELSRKFQSAVLEVSSVHGEVEESSRRFWVEANVNL